MARPSLLLHVPPPQILVYLFVSQDLQILWQMIPPLYHSSPQFKFKWESSIYSSLLGGTYSFANLNFSKASSVSTFSVYNLVACKPSYVVASVENALDSQCSPSNLTYIPFKVHMFFTLWKLYAMFPFNSLALLLQLSLLW